MRKFHLIRVAFTLLILSWAFIMTAPVSAADLVVTRYFSGLWDQPKQESQGILLQVIDQLDDSKKVVAYWFTYGDDLNTAWYMGIGEVVGDHIVLDLYTAYGVGFMEDDLPGNASVAAVGTMILAFKNCNHGTASFDTPEDVVGSGEFEISRLAGLYRSRCSGGISDDTPSHAKPLQMEVALDPARDGITGKGKAKFWERVDRSDFHVSAEGIADGEYQIHVCSDAIGNLLVEAGTGETQFRSPESDSNELLSFDPRNCPIAIHDIEGAVLSSGDELLAEKTNQGHGNGNGNGMKEISLDLNNTGVLPDANGEVAFDINGNNTEFEVEIEDVPVGLYPLHVGGIERGQIEVMADDDKLKGKLRFSDPEKEDRLPLDFSPFGMWIEVYSGTDIILEVLFPEE